MKPAILAVFVLILASAATRADQWSEAWGSPAFVDQTTADTGAAVARQLVDAVQRHAVYAEWVGQQIARLRKENDELRQRCGDSCATVGKADR